MHDYGRVCDRIFSGCGEDMSVRFHLRWRLRACASESEMVRIERKLLVQGQEPDATAREL
jgi:hypothetical protein